MKTLKRVFKIALLSVSLVLSACGMSESDYIDSVKDAKLEKIDANRNLGQMFNDKKMFSTAKWTAWNTDEGQTVVSVEGKLVRGKKYQFLFLLSDSLDSFNLEGAVLDGEQCDSGEAVLALCAINGLMRE